MKIFIEDAFKKYDISKNKASIYLVESNSNKFLRKYDFLLLCAINYVEKKYYT